MYSALTGLIAQVCLKIKISDFKSCGSPDIAAQQVDEFAFAMSIDVIGRGFQNGLSYAYNL